MPLHWRRGRLFWTTRDEDRKLKRVGSLERGKPIRRQRKTAESRPHERLGVCEEEGQGRRSSDGSARAAGERTLKS
jgi:hypothetical protein